MGEEKTKVLVLEVRWIGFSNYVEREAELFKGFEMIYCPYAEEGASWMTLVDQCRDLVVEHNIGIALPICDRGVAILGALKSEFPHIRGPTFESNQMTSDKVLARELIIPEKYNLPHFTLTMQHINDGVPCDAIIDAIGLPAIAKPANGTASGTVCKISTKEDFLQLETEDFAKIINGLMAPVNDLIKKFLDPTKYPDCLSPKYILESYVDQRQVGATVHTVDGLVAGGKMIPWALSDNLYWSHKPETFMSEIMPSRLSQEMQDKSFECLNTVVQKLLPYGFDDQFVNVEVFCFPDGHVKAMEVNGRMCNILKELYANILEAESIIHVAVDVAKGNPGPQKQPTLKPNTCAMLAYLVTFGTGVAGDFLNFDEVKKYPTENKDVKLDLKVTEDSPISYVGDSGYNMGFANIVGSSFEDCTNKMDAIKSRLLLQPESSPWFH